MNLKNILTLKIIGLAAFIIIIFSNYFLAKLDSFSKEVAITNLKKTSIDFVKYTITEKNNKLNQSNFTYQPIVIYDDSNNIWYNNGTIQDVIAKSLAEKLLEQDTIILNIADTTYLAFNYLTRSSHLKVITQAINPEIQGVVNYFKKGLVIFIIIIFLAVILLGRLIAHQTFIPLKNVVMKLEKVSESTLNERVFIGNGKGEIANLAISFNQMLDRLENAFKLQKNFVSNASHEFRTPLTVMKGQIEVLLLQPRNSKYYVDTFKSLLDDINNHIDLINGLASLADAEANFPSVKSKNVSILEVLDECVRDLFKNKNYVVVLNLDGLLEDENTLLIKGDHALLKSAIMNVMDNACKFSRIPTCKVNLDCYEKYMSISVRDEGLGIANEELSKIFDTFYRSNNTRHIQGHGIGLSLVKKIIEFYGGEINASSEINKGTKMIIYFPNINNKNFERHLESNNPT